MEQNQELFIRELQIRREEIPEDSYLRQIRALSGLSRLVLHRNVTFFVGENGSGKSTLLEAAAEACGFNPEGGTQNYNFSTYRSHAGLSDAIRLIKGYRRAKWGYFLRAESFYNVATAEEEYAKLSRYGSEHYHKCSHGESFLKLMQNNFSADSLYLLDEPEAALSPQRQLTLLLELSRCAAAGSQFIIATHSPILLGLPGAEILSFDGGCIRPCSYEETESYQVTKMFLENREQMLKRLEIC